jgi:Rrf2 family transcriptional regulator, iron-sulfur cluster assembly transcription factor
MVRSLVKEEGVGLQLTRGGEYGLRAMTYLARVPEGRVASLREIGRAQEIPESFLAKILQTLVHAGLASSQRGAHGGFALARPGDTISVRDVIEAVDGPVALNGCVLWPEDCTRSGDCALHDVWVRAQHEMMEVLEGVRLSTLSREHAV